jgi:hypothetical protein
VTYTRSPLARIPFPPSIPARSHSARFYSARSYLRHHMVASIGAGVWRGRGIPAEPALAQAGCRGQVAVEARGGAGRAGVSAHIIKHRLGSARLGTTPVRLGSAAVGGGRRARRAHSPHPVRQKERSSSDTWSRTALLYAHMLALPSLLLPQLADRASVFALRLTLLVLFSSSNCPISICVSVSRYTFV